MSCKDCKYYVNWYGYGQCSGKKFSPKVNENDSCTDFILKETNNFRTVCQCCGRTVKGNENKYAVQFQKYPLKEVFGYYVQDKKYSLCRNCLRQIELFIKKGGVMK